MEQHDYLTTREVAALLRVKERKVYDLVSSGDLPARRVTGKLLFARAEIESLLTGASQAAPAPQQPRPDVLVGSHDPLLDWALRESGSGLPAFFDGSLDGLRRFGEGAGIACGMHIFEPEAEDWNVAHVTRAFDGQPLVLIEFARRRMGLITAADTTPPIATIADLRGRRVALRQATAGGRVLFDHLLAQSGLAVDDLDAVPVPARTETDVAAMVAGGEADAALGLESMARQFRLAFHPLIEERYDLLVDRRAWFEPPLQALTGFCRTRAFAGHAAALGGYDISGFGTVRWNGG